MGFFDNLRGVFGKSNTKKEKEAEKAFREGKNNLTKVIDWIATRFITSADFQELIKLQQREYCEKLVILTADVLNKHLTAQQIKYLKKRTEEGIKEGEPQQTTQEPAKMIEQHVTFLDREDLNKMDIRNPNKKQNMCLGIAKFYIKIFHLFSAIATTINPVYTYKDAAGEKHTVPLY